MSKNISEIPFTEMTERIQKLGRVGVDNLSKLRGIINDIYVREIPSKFDWNFLVATTSLVTVDEYHNSSISMNTGDTTVVGASDVVFTSAMVGRKFKPSSNDTVYDIAAYISPTSVTIYPSLQGPTNLSGASYSVFQPSYTLPSDFDRFPKPGGVYRWAGGSKQILPEDAYRPYMDEDFQATASTPAKTRIYGTDTIGNALVELIPAPKFARNYGVDYIRTLKPMRETTAGTIFSIAANALTILGNTNTRFTEANAGDWFRVDPLGTGPDSQWYKIISIQHDSQMTLSSAFANTAVMSSANYTISRAPEMPVKLHEAIMYGTLRSLTLDQNDPNAAFYQSAYAQVMSDAKKIYVSRPYSQELTGVFEDYRYRR